MISMVMNGVSFVEVPPPPNDIARDIAEQDVKPTQASGDVNTKIFDVSGEIDLLKVARIIRG